MKISKIRFLGLTGILCLASPLWAYGGYYGGSGIWSKLGIGLVLLALGYWVLTLSQKQEKPLNTLGRIIGGIILIAALGSIVASAVKCYRYCKAKSGVAGPCCMKNMKSPPMDSKPAQ